MQSRKPAWWQLYIMVPIMFVLLAVEHWLSLPGVSPEAVDAAIVVFTFAGMLGWIHLNGGLLEWYEVDRDKSYYDLKITVHEPTSNKRADAGGSDNLPSYAMPRSFAGIRDEQGIQLKEEQKWFLN